MCEATGTTSNLLQYNLLKKVKPTQIFNSILHSEIQEIKTTESE